MLKGLSTIRARPLHPAARRFGSAAARYGRQEGPRTTRLPEGEVRIVSNTDDLKGRAKEAAGDLTDDKDLKREGQLDQAEGKLKDAVDTVRDKLSGDDKR